MTTIYTATIFYVADVNASIHYYTTDLGFVSISGTNNCPGSPARKLIEHSL